MMSRFFLASCMMLFLAQCKPQINATKEVKTLDSLQVEVSKAVQAFEAIPSEIIIQKLDSIKNIVKFVEENYNGEMTREQGFMLDDYRATKNIVKKFQSRVPQITDEIERTNSQLETLKEAIGSGATSDKSGSLIDKAYVAKQMNIETKAAENLIASITELKVRSERFILLNTEKLEELNPYLESLKNN